ncbi:MAG: M14 family zinc carboxypeptidase [Candidatus Krumholzibacteriia bacterium]
MQFQRPLAVSLLIVLLGASGAVAAGETALVLLDLRDPAAGEFLRAHPELDVAAMKPGADAQIVADAGVLALIRSSGLSHRVLVADLPGHYAARNPDKSGAFGVWHTYGESVAFLDSLRLLYPQVVSEKWSLGQSHQGRDIWCIRISDNPDVDEGEPEMLLDGMHHAREIMSSEFCLMFAEYLAQGYGNDPHITYLLDGRALYVVPVVNPDGVVYNEQTNPAGGGLWRKNRRDNGGSFGVDLNRNYPFHWGEAGSSGVPSDEIYCGPSPGSEPETQALMDLVNARAFVTHQTLHSYSNLTLYPWGYTASPSPDNALYELMAGEMTRYNGYLPGQPPNILYAVSGGAIDWAYGAQDQHPRILSFSNEIGGASDGFWPDPARRGALFQENLWPNLYLLQAAGPFVAVESPVLADADGLSLDPGESGSLSFLVKNVSVVNAISDVTVTVATDDPYVQLGAARRQIASLPAHGSWDAAADPLPVTVDPTCPQSHLVALTVTVAFDSAELSYDLQAMVGSPVVVFSDDLESGTASWTLDEPWGAVTSHSHSPDHSLHDSPGGDYTDLRLAAATMNDAYSASQLVFWHRYDIEDAYDFGRVQVSTDGAVWNTVTSYTGLAGDWHEAVVDLSPYAGQTLRVRFQLETDWSVTEDGWYIDDVTLHGSGSQNATPPAPIALSPAEGAVVHSPPTLTVANSADPDGSGALTYGFRVYADALLTQLVATVDGVAEGSGETSWTAPELAQGAYWWRACAADPVERGPLNPPVSFAVDDSTPVDGVTVSGPRLTMLGNGTGAPARLQLSVPLSGDVRVDVFDARGARVRELHRGSLGAGTQILVWDGRDARGGSVASGIYFVRAEVASRTLIGRVVLVR